MPQDLFSRKEYVFAAFERSVQIAIPIVEATKVPIAKSLLEVVKQIVEIAKVVKSNKEDCESLASRCLDLLSAISKALDSEGSQEAQKRLFENASALRESLDLIKETTESLKAMRLISRIYLSENIKDRIKKHNSELNRAMELFNLEAILTIQSTVVDTNVKVSRMLNMQETVAEAARIVVDKFVFDREPPARPDIFFGRNDYVDKVVDSIINGHPLRLSILGPGGIGKTSAASAIIDHGKIHAMFSSKRYFIKCSTFFSANQMLQGLCEILMGSDGMKTDPTNPLRVLSRFLGALPKVILVLDNFETVWHVQDQDPIKKMLQTLFKLSSLTLIITMRGNSAPEDFTWSRLGFSNILPVLELDDAKKTFRAMCDKYEESTENDTDLSILMKQLDCVPLAVSIVAKMANSETAVTLKQISANLKLYLETDRLDPTNSVEASIALSINSFAIKQRPESIDILKVIAYLPSGATIDSVTRMTSSKIARQLIRALQSVGLIHGEGDRFNTLSPIRICIEDKYPLDSNMQQSVFEYYFQVCAEGPSSFDSLVVKFRLAAEKANCIKVLSDAARSHEKDIGDVTAIINFTWFLLKTCPSVELLQLVKRKFEAYNSVPIMAEYHRTFGESAILQGDYREAEKIFQQVRDEFDSVGDKVGAARCILSLGNIARMQSNHEDAKRMLLDAKGRFDGAGDSVGAAHCLLSLGHLAKEQDNYEEATKMVQDAKGHFDGVEDRVQAAGCLRNLGDIATAEGKYDDAKTMLLQAKDQFDSIGNRAGAAGCIQGLGDIAGKQGNYEDAEKLLLDAKSKLDDIGDIAGSTHCIYSLHNLARERGNYEESRKLILEGRARYESFGYRFGAVRCVELLGQTAMEFKDYEEAKSLLLEAKDFYEAIGAAEDLARCQRYLDHLMQLTDIINI